MSGVKGQISHEWSKLFSLRGTYLTLAIGFFVTLGLCALTVKGLTASPGAGYSQTEMVRLCLRTTIPALLAVTLLAIGSVRTDKESGVLALSILRAGSRERTWRAKSVVIGGVAATYGLVVGLAECAMVVAVGHTTPSSALSFWLASPILFAIVCVGWAAVGLALGLVMPGLAAAVVVAMGLPMVVEPAAAEALGAGMWRDLLPFRAGFSLLEIGIKSGGVFEERSAPLMVSVAIFAGLILLVSTASSRRFQQVDL